ncbi:hypothetical protein JGI1_01584 [Candidatus Thermokryptus mobilis]|uniref:Uncharacterized protein n=1 Tax=Candidatus Thermokryptus mobilis TaxID=1643428 RepID=A0A0S4N8Y7_9BACT|nr:hypothetical protein [Candidatus Thermokryptus mobilis]CUU06662.1 hypothetical protein JGI1_01584 [Candidatus Thermokryptus mobilis]
MSKSAKKSSGKKGKKGKRIKQLNEKSIEILPVIEYAIYEVDKIFQNQGDRLTDAYLVSSLKGLVNEIKSKSFKRLLEEVRGEMIEDPDIIHWDIVSRLGDHIESGDLNYSDKDIIKAIDGLIDTIKIQMSKENPRAYLSFLSEIMRGADDFDKGMRSDIEPEIDDFDEDENF